MISSIESIEPSKRRPIRFLVNHRIVVAFSVHAVKRMAERNITAEEVIFRISGKRPGEWRRLGVVGKYKKQIGFVSIITCW